MLCTTSIKLTLIVFGMVPVVIVPIVFLGRKVKGASAQTQKQVAHLSAHIDETLSAIRTVQAYMREDGEITTFAESVKSVYDASLCRTKIRSILVAIVISTVFLSISAILFLGGHMVIANSITAGALSSFVFYAIIVAASTGALSEIYSDVQRAYGAVQALMNLLDIESNIIDAYMPSTLPKLFRSTITFQNVNFTYPAYPDIATLHDVNLTVGSGEKIAIVGPSGSGKSTIFNLLLRFYDITSGSITVDGVDIRNITLKDLRAIFGFVSQDPVIFSGSAFDNIIYGQPGASEKEAIKAAEAAGAMEFLQHLPDGIHSFVGEKGVTLSGGQRQRLSIARVILKNPKILLLDEATSALDSSNEFYIQEALFKLMGDKTIFMIAHRLSTIRDADRIVVMHKGRIEATGNHSDLMKNCKLYAELVHLQET
jgi:ATP-binding cassette subfamily B protein